MATCSRVALAGWFVLTIPVQSPMTERPLNRGRSNLSSNAALTTDTQLLIQIKSIFDLVF